MIKKKVTGVNLNDIPDLSANVIALRPYGSNNYSLNNNFNNNTSA